MASMDNAPHSEESVERLPADFSASQIAAFLAFVIIFCVYAYSAALRFRLRPVEARQNGNDIEHTKADSTLPVDTSAVLVPAELGDQLPTVLDVKEHPSGSRFVSSLLSSPLTDVVCLKHAALFQHQQTIDAITEFSIWMILFLLSDRTRILRASEKSYSRDVFLTVFTAIVAVSFGSLSKEKRVTTLSRQQTEEWKGWMQVMFLLYHYFEAREAYNAIRVLIAGYVWMTGYGNFHYYYRTNDFCVGRFAQMMWRLNFLVVACCIVLRNDYMLYYICPMHTVFTVLVYVSLGVCSRLNSSRMGMAAKLIACVVMVMILWDTPGVFYTVWKPFKFLVAYDDPRKPSADTLHEWYFRSSLDRYVWIFGMAAAWMHPHIESAWAKIDSFGFQWRNLSRTAIVAACMGLLYVWYTYVYTLEKIEYNRVHPYTSWVPISLWVILRNLTPQLRQHSLGLLGWLGCTTLETYISQFHIWLRTIIPNGQPKYILDLVPGYPLMNFLLASIVYIGVSRRLFTLTNILKSSFVPHDNDRLLARNVTLMAISALILYLIALMIHIFVYQSL